MIRQFDYKNKKELYHLYCTLTALQTNIIFFMTSFEVSFATYAKSVIVLACLTICTKVTHNEICQLSRGAVAYSEERPSKDPVWCNSTDVGSNHERDISSFLSLHTRHKVVGIIVV